jgi:hypothetical protein
MVSTGPEGVDSFSIGFFDMAAAEQPKPQTVAIIAADPTAASFLPAGSTQVESQLKIGCGRDLLLRFSALVRRSGDWIKLRMDSPESGVPPAR